MEDEKMRMEEGDMHEDAQHHIGYSFPHTQSSNNLHDEVGNIDLMINDLQALQQQFGMGNEAEL